MSSFFEVRSYSFLSFFKGDLSAHYHRVLAKANFPTGEKIANLLLNRFTLYPEKAIAEGDIPSNADVLAQSRHVSLDINHPISRAVKASHSPNQTDRSFSV
jgi:hypothetical protein